MKTTEKKKAVLRLNEERTEKYNIFYIATKKSK
jgi:hypothetical protein